MSEDIIFEENLVSIITPAHNAGMFINETIESILKQTYTQWELLVVDDASNDDTCDIIISYQKRDKRIKLIRLEVNNGVANARNVGMQNAKGRYIAFLDSDDLWLSNKLSLQIDFMKNNDIAFSFTQYRHFQDDIKKCGKLIELPSIVDYKTLLKANVIGCLTVIIDRKVISNFNMIKERHEDYIAWLSILKKGFKAYCLQEDLARYRISRKSLSSNKINCALWTWTIYRKVEKLKIYRAIYYFIHYAINGIHKHALK